MKYKTSELQTKLNLTNNMKSLLISLISLSALLLAVSGQLSSLSPSYSFQGTVVGNISTQVSFTGITTRAIDVTRRLAHVDLTFTLTGGVPIRNIVLFSGDDNAQYNSVDGVCDESPLPPDDIPLNTSTWDLYAAGTESPAGTFAFTLGLTTFQVTIVNGEPAVFTTNSGTSVSVTTVTSFDNTTPAFSTFFLPSGCSQFTCTACYHTLPFPNLSPSYSLQGSLVRTVNGLQASTVTYSVSVDVNRQLQFVDETVTTKRVVSNTLRLSSEADSATYRSINGVCSETIFSATNVFPLDTNVWDLYAAGTESPAGTYSYTQNGITRQVTIVNEIPVLFTFSLRTTIIAITVTNFNNITPTFSTFSLPTECTQFTCDACYQTPPFPVLSPSYSVSGTGLIEETGQASTTFTFEFSIDIDRQLQRLEESDTTSDVTTNFIEISSASDQATYTSVDGVCVDTTTYNPSIIFPIDTNVWDLYAAGTESPIGTYTFTQNDVLHRVEIEDGLPTFFGFAFGNTIIVINVDNFRNKTPAFSTFCLPSECSVNECNACYNGAAAVASSVLLLLSALLVYLFTAH